MPRGARRWLVLGAIAAVTAVAAFSDGDQPVAVDAGSGVEEGLAFTGPADGGDTTGSAVATVPTTVLSTTTAPSTTTEPMSITNAPTTTDTGGPTTAAPAIMKAVESSTSAAPSTALSTSTTTLAQQSTTTTSTVPPATVAPTTAALTTAGGCNPNYSGCVPIAADVDCAGGGGNGPAYVEGPVQVIGTDVYDLDRDNDGIGCERD